MVLELGAGLAKAADWSRGDESLGAIAVEISVRPASLLVSAERPSRHTQLAGGGGSHDEAPGDEVLGNRSAGARVVHVVVLRALSALVGRDVEGNAVGGDLD